MARIRWKCQEILNYIYSFFHFREKWYLIKLNYRSLFYNEFTSCGVVLDTLIEPLIWFVDHFVRYLGPAFVMLIVSLVTAVSVMFYICLLPQQLQESGYWACVHLIVGNYFLYCTIFYYFRAAFTEPGFAPEEIPETVSICKKCVAPKPPRSHHCSVCKKCVLKMDHHCPWLNNCIGHNNHRYFLMFCTYMWVGTTYASAVAYPLFRKHFYGEEAGPSGFVYPFYLAYKFVLDSQYPDEVPRPPQLIDTVLLDKADQQKVHANLVKSYNVYNPLRLKLHSVIVYEFMLCSAVSVALFFLLMWHCRLVMKGETSIEFHVNKKQADRMRKKGLRYKNPYDFGIIENFRMLLGISRKPLLKHLFTHVIIPSSHPPQENGLTWKTNNYLEDRTLHII